MRKRTIKKCECGYELTEKTKRGPSKSVEGKVTCPDCGGQASHFMYVDKENIDESTVVETDNMTFGNCENWKSLGNRVLQNSKSGSLIRPVTINMTYGKLGSKHNG